MSIKSRINKLENHKGEFLDIELLISQGAYYDEISPDQQALYDKYKGIPMSVYVEGKQAIERAFNEDDSIVIPYPPHIKLEKNLPEPTPEELAKIIEEVRLAMEDARADLL